MSTMTGTDQSQTQTSVVLRVPGHPDNPSCLDFPETSFFTRTSTANPQLPSPSDVLARNAKDPLPNNVVMFED